MQDFRMETFLTVCRLLNYSRAAEKLSITQPAVSQHIRYLEDYYGVRLFGYEGKCLHLTEAGDMLLSAAKTMAHDEKTLRENMQKGGKLKLLFGATRTIGDFVLPAMLIKYVKRYPESEIQMLVDNTQNLLRAIDEGEIDFAVIEGYFNKSEYEYKLYSDERYIAVCSNGYSFFKKPAALEDLFDERILLREPGSGTREILERHMNQRNYSITNFRQRTEVGSIHAIKSLVAGGCGITFLYEAAAAKELQSGVFKEIVLSDFDIFHNFTVVWRKNSIFFDRYKNIYDVLFRANE
jgi:DNA-binding transcriptional LysR family regulator